MSFAGFTLYGKLEVDVEVKVLCQCYSLSCWLHDVLNTG